MVETMHDSVAISPVKHAIPVAASPVMAPTITLTANPKAIGCPNCGELWRENGILSRRVMELEAVVSKLLRELDDAAGD